MEPQEMIDGLVQVLREVYANDTFRTLRLHDKKLGSCQKKLNILCEKPNKTGDFLRDCKFIFSKHFC